MTWEASKNQSKHHFKFVGKTRNVTVACCDRANLSLIFFVNGVVSHDKYIYLSQKEETIF